MTARDDLVLHLKRCGYVDPEDGTVSAFPHGRSNYALWVPVEKLAEAILAAGYRKVGDDETVERVAKALALHYDIGCFLTTPDDPFESMGPGLENQRNYYREMARVALGVLGEA